MGGATVTKPTFVGLKIFYSPPDLVGVAAPLRVSASYQHCIYQRGAFIQSLNV